MVSMPHRAAARLAAGCALLLTVSLAGCAAPQYADVSDVGAGIHFQIPHGWRQIDALALARELKTATGAITVTLNDKTKYEHGNQTVTKSHLQKGERVSVFGTKLATGELVAREVLIGAPQSHATHK